MGVLTTTPALSLINPTQLESYGVSRARPDRPDPASAPWPAAVRARRGARFLRVQPDVRIAAAVAAIVTKGGGLLLTISRPEVFAQSSTVAMVFDPICIVLLTAIIVDILVQSRRTNAKQIRTRRWRVASVAADGRDCGCDRRRAACCRNGGASAPGQTAGPRLPPRTMDSAHRAAVRPRHHAPGCARGLQRPVTLSGQRISPSIVRAGSTREPAMALSGA